MQMMRIANAIKTVDVVYPELSYKVNGILFAVHNELGRMYNEQQYCDALEKYLKQFELQYEREKVLPVAFEDEIKGRHKVDFLVEDKIILEIKAKRIVGKEDYYQVRRYSGVLNKKLGILVNFREKYIHPKRILNSTAKL